MVWIMNKSSGSYNDTLITTKGCFIHNCFYVTTYLIHILAHLKNVTQF